MSFPMPDIVMLSVTTASTLAGLSMWYWLSRRTRSLELQLQPMTSLLSVAAKPANEVTEEAAPDSSVRIRVGARMRAVDSH